jgi:hypothetical protein
VLRVAALRMRTVLAETPPRTWLQVARRDLASVVIHWTKARPASHDFIDEVFGEEAQAERDAPGVLADILEGSCLKGGTGYIRGGHRCVCFTEAPLAEMVAVFAAATLASQANALRYEPFGVGVGKEWLFRLGGRPVIYQPDYEYDGLAKDFQWRHCRYEPPAVDFSWEREWRIAAERLELYRAQTWIFVPTLDFADRLTARRPGWRIVPLELFGLPPEAAIRSR